MNQDKSKTGPKPKELKPVQGLMGLEIGRGDTRAVVPPDQVFELTSLGLNSKEIAQFYGVTDDSIRRNFAAEIAKGQVDQKIKLRRAMFKNATENMNAAVQIFLAKAVLGMREESAENNQPLPWNEAEDQDDITKEQENDRTQGHT